MKVVSRGELGFLTMAARRPAHLHSWDFSLDAFGPRAAAAITDGWKTGTLWHGIRATVITDNGPQFACQEFAQLALHHWNVNILCPTCAPKSDSRRSRSGHSFLSTPHLVSETVLALFEERAFPEQTRPPEKV